MKRLMTTVFLLLAASFTVPALSTENQATLYKNPSCDCCQNYAEYLEANGFQVKVIPTDALDRLHRQHGVPEHLAGCHMTKIDGYVFEGHVPVDSIKRFLKEKPRAKGLTVPGMPAGSPGMSGSKQGPLNVYTLTDTGAPKLYATH